MAGGRLMPMVLVGIRAAGIGWELNRRSHPNANGPIHRIKYAKSHMDRGGAQKAMKVVVRECGIKKKSPSIRFATAMPPIFWNVA